MFTATSGAPEEATTISAMGQSSPADSVSSTTTDADVLTASTTTTTDELIIFIVIGSCGLVAIISSLIILIKIIRLRLARSIRPSCDDKVEMIAKAESESNNSPVLLSVSRCSSSSVSLAVVDTTTVSILEDTRVVLEDLADYVRARRNQEGEDVFRGEFKSLPYNQCKSWTAATDEKLRPKNRFKDILPYDENRVKLEVIDDDPITNYINASYIQGYEEGIKFIACIGPTPHSKDDFWRMILEQKVHVIVMVTRLVENGVAKCTQYWPEASSMLYGSVYVKMESEDVWPEFVLRKFKIYAGEDAPRLVNHFHYTAWPDKGVPTDGTALVNFRKRVEKAMVPNHPTVVHCSAGVGRTGTFIALDTLLRQADKEQFVNVYECVRSLRLQRIYMVQTLDQYRFIHDALALQITIGDTNIPSARFSAEVEALNENPPEGLSRMALHFKVLLDSCPIITEADKATALSDLNRPKNRYHNILPMSSKRIYLKKRLDDGSDNYINAVTVDSYQKMNAFASTQIPLDDTKDNFWQMVLEQRSNCVVKIITESQKEDDTAFIPTSGNEILLDEFGFTFESEENTDGVNITTIKVSVSGHFYENVEDLKSDTPEYSLKLFEVQLPGSEQLLPPKTAVQLYTAVHQWHLHGTETPVIVTCLNGSTFCGQFIATYNLLSMLNLEQEVNVFQIVRQLKRSRPEFINTLEQYQGLHSIVEEYIKLFDNYANFKAPQEKEQDNKKEEKGE